MGAERFVQIPIALIRENVLSPEAKVVGFVYASYANRDGFAWPGMKQLMKCSGMGRDRVKRGRTELVRNGFLKRVQQRGEQTSGGRFGRVRYEVLPKLLIRRRTESQSSGEKGDLVKPRDRRRTGGPVDGSTAGRKFRRPVFQSTELYE